MTDTPERPETDEPQVPTAEQPGALAGDAPADTSAIPAPQQSFGDPVPAHEHVSGEHAAGSSEAALDAAAGSSHGATPTSAAEQPITEAVQPPVQPTSAELVDLSADVPPAPPVQASVPASVLDETASAVPQEAREVAFPPPVDESRLPEPSAAADDAGFVAAAAPVEAPAQEEKPKGRRRRKDAAVELGAGQAAEVAAGQGSGVPVIFPIAIVLLLAMLAASLTMLMLKTSNQSALNSRKAKAITEAKSFAHDVTDYNYDTLDKNFAAVLGHATGKFKQEYTDSTKPDSQFVSLVKSAKATSTSEVLDAGVISSSKSKAVILVMISQTTQNTSRPTPLVSRNVGRVSLTWVKNRWMVEDFTIL